MNEQILAFMEEVTVIFEILGNPNKDRLVERIAFTSERLREITDKAKRDYDFERRINGGEGTTAVSAGE